jgi:DNA-binding transcriptional LysR family regulator
MNLHHLRYFIVLAELEHYTKAADILSITQPSLSHAISLLEKELGILLFEKNGRNISLTKDGKDFLIDVKNSISILDNGVKKIELLKEGNGIINIGFLRILGTFFLPKVLKNFLNTNKNKNVYFNLFTDTGLSRDLLTGVKNKKYDVVFCSKFEDDPLIEFIPIYKQNLVLVVNIKHPLASKKEVSIEETLMFPYVLFKEKSGLRHITNQLFEKIGKFPENVIFEIEEDQVIAGFISEGFGIAILPDIEILDSLNVKKIKIKDLYWERKLYMATLKNSYHSKVVKNFCNYIEKNYKVHS